MKRYLKYVKPYWYAFILGPILMITEVAGEVILPAYMARIINVGAANRDVPYIIGTGLTMIAIAFIMMGGGIGGAWFASKASISFGADLRNDCFKKVQKFSFANIDAFSTGSLVTRLTNDITQVQNLIMMGLRMMLRAPGMLIGAIIMAFSMNARLARVFLVIMPVMIIAITIIMRTAFPRFTIMQKKLDKVNSNIQETLQNVRVIKSFVRGEYEEKRFSDSNEDLKDSSLRASRWLSCRCPSWLFYERNHAGSGMDGRKAGACGGYAGRKPDSLYYLYRAGPHVTDDAGHGFLQSSRAVASARRINEILDTEIDLTDENAKQTSKTVQEGRIEFQQVSFRYYKDSQEKVLDDVSLTIEPGQTVGIIGSTGCGKTTLVP